jgi:hypothetical protein
MSLQQIGLKTKLRIFQHKAFGIYQPAIDCDLNYSASHHDSRQREVPGHVSHVAAEIPCNTAEI